ncbi:hypothetical protein M8J76_007694 [Diaphorina citri]|nr:hypothetical protein M8J76_007694 [Diaphorina citri]
MNATTANDVKKHPGLSDTSEVSNNTPTLYIWDNTTAINIRNNTPVYILNNTMNNLDNATTDDTNSDPWNHTSAENTEEYDYIEPSEVANERTEENITQYECGRRIVENPNFTEVSGRNTYFGEFPWMLALFYYKRNMEYFKCGASLISPNIALTAAHCVQYDVTYSVAAGEWFINGIVEEELEEEQRRDVLDVRIHPNYSTETLENNIALLKLSSNIDFDDYIHPICLADWNVTYDSENCVITGWGRDSADDKSYNQYLRQVGLNLLPRDKCQNILRQSSLGQYYEIMHGYICAWNGSSEINSCKGDGGGPLVCPSKEDPTIFFQVGIAAWSVVCTPDMPGLYTNIEYYRDWIDETVLAIQQEETEELVEEEN